jgi:hypothetical protein
VLLVAAVYVGIEVTGLLVGFAMLHKPVGLSVGMSRERIERTVKASD